MTHEQASAMRQAEKYLRYSYVEARARADHYRRIGFKHAQAFAVPGTSDYYVWF